MKESKKLGPFDKAKRILQAGVVAGANLLGSVGAHGQEVPNSNIQIMDKTDDSEKTQRLENISKENEEYWLQLDTAQAVQRYQEYSSRDFAEHVLSSHLTQNPLSLLENAKFLKFSINYKEIIRKAAENVYKDDVLCSDLLEPQIVDIYKDELNNYSSFFERAAEKTLEINPLKILRKIENIFKHLSPARAEGIFRKAVDTITDKNPLDVIPVFGVIKNHLPDADRIIFDISEKCIKEGNPINFLDAFAHLPDREKIFSPAMIKNLMDKIVEEDPLDVLCLIREKNTKNQLNINYS